MICNINEDTGEIKIVSVFRDSYLNIDDEGSYNKINLAYFRGGPTQAVKALNDELLSEVKNKGMSFRRYNDRLVEACQDCIYPAMENEKKKAMREVSDWEKNAVMEIILTLELGGTKADLERMLKELD